MFDIVIGDFDVIPYSLPNLDRSEEAFNTFVDENVETQLRKFLGNFFYDAFISALEKLPDWIATISPNGYSIGDQVAVGNDVWESLTDDNIQVVVEGADWHLVEANNKWLLLKNGTDFLYNDYPFKWVGMHTMLVPAMYALYTAASVKQQTALGIVIASAENSEVVSSADNIVRGWNKYARYGCDLYTYLRSTSESFDDLFTDNAYKTMQAYIFKSVHRPGRQNVFDI